MNEGQDIQVSLVKNIKKCLQFSLAVQFTLSHPGPMSIFQDIGALPSHVKYLIRNFAILSRDCFIQQRVQV